MWILFLICFYFGEVIKIFLYQFATMIICYASSQRGNRYPRENERETCFESPPRNAHLFGLTLDFQPLTSMEDFQESSALNLAWASLNFTKLYEAEHNDSSAKNGTNSSEGGGGDPFWNEILTMSVCRGTNGATLSEILFTVTKWIEVVEGYAKVRLQSSHF